MALSSEEQLLIARAIRREPEAFAELYTQYYEYVLRRVTRIVGNRSDAEDLTSEAFLRAWNSIAKFEDRGVSIAAWFARIGEHLALRFVKSRKISVPVEDGVGNSAREDDPDSVAEQNAEVAVLRSALEQLPVLQKQVIARRFLDGASYTELEGLTGKQVGTVRVIQHRALKALRNILTRDDEVATAIEPAALN